MTIQWSKLLVVAMSLAVLSVGCGSEDGGANNGNGTAAGEGPPRGVSLSRPEFIEEAAKGCRGARSALEEDVARFLKLQRDEKPRPVLYKDLARLVLLPTIEAEIESIRFLGVPPSEEERVDEILRAGDFVIGELVYEPRIESIDVVYRRFAEVRRMFRAYGLPACVNGASVTGGSA